LGSADSAWLPQISVTGSESRDYGDHADAYGNLVSTPQDSRDAAANLSWTVFDFGAREGRIRSARHLLDAAAATTNRAIQQTILIVTQGFYGVIAADASLAAAQTTESTAAKSLDVARSLRTGGVATQGDVLQAQTAFDQSVLARMQSQFSAQSAHGALAASLGLTADQPLKLTADPVPTAVPVLAARMSDLMAQAVKQRPDLAAAQAQRDSAEADVSVVRATGWPTIALSASRNFVGTTGVPNQTYGVVGVSVTVPIFLGFSVDYGVRQAQAALEGRNAGLEQSQVSVSLDVWNAYYGLQSANDQLTETGTLLTTAQDNLDVALGRYQSGVGTIIDLLTAQTAAGTARQVRINSELNWEIARSQLALALGRLTGAEPLNTDASLP
jgi:outer membrane protein